MTIEMIVVDAQHQVRVVNLAKGESLTVAHGDTIRLTKKADIKTFRKGNDLVIKNASGEEFVLKDFYLKTEAADESQLLSWDDTLDQEKEILSSEYSEPIKAVEATAATDQANSEVAPVAAEAAPAKEDGDDKAAALLLGNSSGEAPMSMLAGIATLGFILLQTGSGGHGGGGGSPAPTPANNSLGAVNDTDPLANTVTDQAANGTPVGVVVLAVDPDAGSTVSYSLVNNAGGHFAINPNTGVVTVANGAALDHASAQSHVIRILATSSDGTASERDFTINVVDTTAPAAPVINLIATNDVVDANEATAGITISGTGEIGATVTLTFTSGTTLAGGNTALVDGAGNWSVAVTTADIAAMGQNPESVTAIQTDAASNPSASTIKPFTIDSIAPTAMTFSPADDLSSASPSANLVVTFSENVFAGIGNVRIVNDTDGTTTTIAISSPEISISGGTLTINPTADLLLAKAYHVEIDSGALVDGAGNIYSGISTSTAWNFGIGDPGISINMIATDGKVDVLENAGAITVSGTVFSSVVPVLTDLLASDITVILTPQGGGAPISVTVTSYNNVTGVWSGTIPANTFDPAFNAVANKSYDVAASFMGTTGNAVGYNASATSLVTVDTVVPTQTVSINSISLDTGIANDFITSDVNGLTVNATLSTPLNSGEILQYSNNNGATWADVTTSVAGTSVTVVDSALTSTNTVHFRVVDAAANTGTATSQLVTIDNSAPLVTPAQSFTYAENQIAGAVVATVAATDNIGVTAYRFDNGTQTSTDGYFAINNSGQISITAAGIAAGVAQNDFETAPNSFNYNVQAGDVSNLWSTATAVTLTVNDVIEAPAVALNITNLGNSNVAENGAYTSATPVLTGTPIGAVTYTLSGTDAALFTVDAGTGVVSMIARDFEAPADAGANNVYDYVLTATDADGNFDTQAVAVTVTDVDEIAPIVTAPDLNAIDDTGTSNTDDNTDQTSGLNFSGTVSEAATVTLFSDNNRNGEFDGLDTVLGTSIMAAAGTWDIEAALAYSAEPYRVHAVATDTAGNVGAASARTWVSVNQFVIELSDIAAGIGGFVINGELAGDHSGYSVSNAGDVNGDGYDDVIIGAVDDALTATYPGSAYIVFGKATTTEVNLATLGTQGFEITNNIAGTSRTGFSVSAAGDINGDGLADVIIGSPWRDAGTSGVVIDRGVSYVVYGKTDSGSVSLSTIHDGTSTQGFAIKGSEGYAESGYSVSAAGDVNGDGLADLIIGEPLGDGNGSADSGRSYVVYGQATNSNVDLSAVEASGGVLGFVISGRASEASGESGYSVSGAGDVNGDGYADLIIGERLGDASSVTDSGRTYVVFGAANNTNINVIDLNNILHTQGFLIQGIAEDSAQSGYSVSAAGDINGDGYADMVVGEYLGDANGLNNAGRAYVVLGQATYTSNVLLSDIANNTGGFVINGAYADDWTGNSVSAAGDVNGDGLGDLIIGAKFGDAHGSNTGRSYVVYGTTTNSTINLGDVIAGIGGFAIRGADVGDISGTSVSAAGDINGDGLADLIVGASNADPASGADAGKSYIIFGGTQLGTTVEIMGTTANDTLAGSAAAQTIVGGAGNDTITGNGGADVLYGGMGDDTFIFNTSDAGSNIEALTWPASATGGQLARVDGGNGIDTIKLDGSGITLDLTAIANQAGANPDGGSRIESIERIDLTGTGNNTLTLEIKDVLDMSGMNVFNNANGWADGTYNLAAGGANPEQRHQVVIDGNAGDVVNSSGWGAQVGTVTNGGQTYAVYNATGYAAQLLIDTDITRNVL